LRKSSVARSTVARIFRGSGMVVGFRRAQEH
jgi:hypothetical protein